MPPTPSVDIREQLGLAKNEDLFKYFRLLIYGDPDAGKTHLAATAQDHKELDPALHLSFEKGLLTVAYRDNYDKKEIRTIDELENTYAMLKKDQESAKPHYKTVIMDNATELQNLDIDTVMREAKSSARDPSKVDIDVPSQREWGKIGKRLRRVVTGFRDLEMHTIWTAWKGEWTEESSNITYIYPKLSGFMKKEFSGYFDVVGLLTSDKINNGERLVHYLQVQGTKRVTAKWRNRPTDIVPDVIEDPTIPMIWDFVKKSKIAAS